MEICRIYMPKLDGLEGGADDLHKDSEDDKDFQGINEDGVDVALLESEVPNRDYAEYIIESIKRDVKCEDSLVRKIVYTIVSKDSNDPLNLGILAPTSEGKTHPVKYTLPYFGNKDIWIIGTMSPRYLIRQYGVTVDEKGEPIEQREEVLLRAIKRAKADRDATLRHRFKKKQKKLEKGESEGEKEPKFDFEGRRVIEIEEADEDDTLERVMKELDELYQRSKTVINLQGKLLVFLEPPYLETWNIIKPILSHDSFEIEHPYVDKVDGRIRGIRVVTRGWPAVIMCSAKDEAEQQYWSEIQSRFDICSPNMVAEKYRQGNDLLASRAGDPYSVQQKEVIDDFRKRVAAECGKYIANRVKRLSHGKYETRKNLTWIPYTKILGKALPAEKGTDNRINSRVFTYLKMIAIARSHLRKKLVFGDEELVIVDIKEDLHEALHISQNNIGIPTFKLERFRDVFFPLWFDITGQEAIAERDIQAAEALPEDSNKAKIVHEAYGRSLKQVVDGQRMLVVTCSQLCNYFKVAKGKPITTENMNKTYLKEWAIAGLIDETTLDGRKTKGYYPIVPLEQFNGASKFTPKALNGNFSGSVVERMRNITQHASIISTRIKTIRKHWLYERLVAMMEAREYMSKPSVEVYDEQGNRICIYKFVQEFENESSGHLVDFLSGVEYDRSEEIEYDDKIFQCEEYHYAD